ncbi:hypothetical protein UA08_08684 [Talaromyces atroroseus]|uniref:Major facilitator superfamily (MFS) profile domain-containing protein n=1 Tax=Talaromyces atroroseus TaxID=1441469 RepID=A0A225ARN6_TALAT|nr:hypothetical protein UA08_08684 [Talaromyces atroroseus]OKL56107.1 hypothetical protein UA08_08684 [Talaromyces atroroseus]
MNTAKGSAGSHVSFYNALIIAFACFGSITYGYCSSIIGTTLGQPSFTTYFGLATSSNAHGLEGAMNGLFQAGGLFGTLSFGYVADKFGRRTALFTSSVICVIGGALQAGSVDIAMFIVARFITGFGVGGNVFLVPLWQSEIAPPHARGLLVGLHGIFILVGYNIATWLGVGFFYVNAGGAQWRPPLAIQCLPPLILALGVPFIPESPRWLIDHQKEERARLILTKLHESKRTEQQESFADQEFYQIKTQLEYERTQDSSCKAIFTTDHYRKRAIIGFYLLFAGQLTGTTVINNYGPTLYASLGYGAADQLILSGGWLVLGLVANVANAILLDRVGRRWLMVSGMIGCLISLIGEIIMLALFQCSDNKSGKIAGVFFLYLHLAFYGTCIDGSTYVYGSEIWPTHLRGKGFSLSVAGLFVGSTTLLTAAPTAFARIGWKFYLVMTVCTVISTIFICFWPETKGLPLEEIAAKFGEKVTVQLNDSADAASVSIADVSAPVKKAENEK